MATRGRSERRRQQQEEELERESTFQEHLEEEGNEDNAMFSTIETDKVIHPQFQDPVIQRTLAHQKLMRKQSEDIKITYIIDTVLNNATMKKLTFLKRTKESRKKSIEFYMIDVVLYAHQGGNGKGKPVLPDSMVIPELYKAHNNTVHTGTTRAIENMRQRFHHSPATSVTTLEEIADKTLPCHTCMLRKKVTLTRGFLSYAEARSILMSVGGVPCSVWSHDIFYLISKDRF